MTIGNEVVTVAATLYVSLLPTRFAVAATVRLTASMIIASAMLLASRPLLPLLPVLMIRTCCKRDG
ncbi:hypothetical protein AU509_08205 [Lonsdalea britannica]|nr:hypothetical protein AU509_08205 [Lonsdalea britannica]